MGIVGFMLKLFVWKTKVLHPEGDNKIIAISITYEPRFGLIFCTRETINYPQKR
jgi:hypothetical protein